MGLFSTILYLVLREYKLDYGCVKLEERVYAFVWLDALASASDGRTQMISSFLMQSRTCTVYLYEMKRSAKLLLMGLWILTVTIYNAAPFFVDADTAFFNTRLTMTFWRLSV